MKSPQDMRIIQIDITNACVFQCSNCTRFCGHHKKPFFMTYDEFVQAVDSLDGYVGTIGMMGGEPTLNPDFERMAEYLASKKPSMLTDKLLRPQKHFMDSIHDLEFEHTFLYPLSCGEGKRQTVDGPGLWATTKGYYKKYYETIQDTAQYQALNDHSRPMYHQPALISRKALGISDEEWIPMRDKCWIQNEWSASITPKGAFFCEVAASLDMLFSGPGGWKVEPGWWKRTPEDFGDQLHWCEMCGLACKTYMRNANEQVYDVSPDVYERLKDAGSRLVGTDHINVVKIKDGVINEDSKAEGKRFSESMPYTESYSARFDEEKTSLTKKEIIGLIICDENAYTDLAAETALKFDKAYIYAAEEQISHIQKEIDAKRSGSEKPCDITYRAKASSLGDVINEIVGVGHFEKYLMVICNDVHVCGVLDDLRDLVLNPGTLLFSEYTQPEENAYFSSRGDGIVTLFSGAAKSYQEIARRKLPMLTDIRKLPELWQKRKVFAFHPDTVYEAPTVKIEKEKKYVIYGAGAGLYTAIKNIVGAGATVAGVVDSNPDLWGERRCDYIIQNPDEILQNPDQFDNVMISSAIYYREIKRILLKKGISENRMAWI